MTALLKPSTSRVFLHACLSFAFLIAFAVSVSAQTAKRVALVIGNSSYESVADLKNPANDARDVARTLSDIGFEVELKLDLSQLELLRAFQEFQRASAGSEMAIVYYAGHGIEIDKQNYLVPVSATLRTDRDVIFEAVPLETALLSVEGASKVSLVIIDACRDNPFAATMVKTSATRSIGRGLAVVEPQGNTLVAYAAREGTTASDGAGRNSPYAAALINVLQEPGVEIGKMFRRVRDEVMSTTNNQQEPFTYGSLSAEDLFIHPPKPAPEPEPEPEIVAALNPQPAPAPIQLPQTQNRTVDRELDALFWESVKDSGDPQAIELYLRRFPDGVFADLAQLRLMILQREQVPPAPVNTPTQQVAVAPPAAVQTTRPPAPAPQTTTATVAPVAPVAEEAPQVAALAPTEESRVVVIQPDQSRANAAAPSLKLIPPSGEAIPSTDTATAAPVVQTVPAEPFVLNREKIRTVQRQLNALGYDTGRPDGVVGRRTRGGVSAFQAAFGLPETGEIDAAFDQRLNAAISEDRLTYYEDKFLRARVNRRLANAGLHGTYCHVRPDGSLADGLDGRPFVCTYVRPLTNRVLDVQSYFGHLRNANGNAMFPILTRAQGSGETYTEDDGTVLTISNGVMRAGDQTFMLTNFPS